MKPLFTPLPLVALIASASLSATESNVELPGLIVSADFRPTIASETPVSLTEIDEEIIDSRNAQHLEEVLGLAPNVNVSSGASRGRYYQIRGMGERSQFSAPINPSVGLIIDGIDFSRSGGAATLFDVETVEILRGPQGTKFGTNALAGTVFIRSKEPTEEFSLNAEAGVGQYDTRNVGIAVGGTLIENKVLGRASIYSHQSDGYMDNDFLNRDDTMQQDEITARGKLKFLVSDELTIDVSYLHLDINNGYDAFTLENTRTSFADNPGSDEQESDAIAIKAEWQASDAVIVQAETTYMNTDIVYSFDADWGFNGRFDSALFPYNGFSRFDRERDNISLDVRILSDQAGRIFNGTTDWTLGVYHLSQDEYFNQNADFGVFGGTFRDGDYDTKNTAVYGQLDIQINDKLTLITGARIEKFKADYNDSTSLAIDTDEVLYGGKIGLNYKANETNFIYSSLSRGYKSGGVNNDATLADAQREFETEYNYTFEAGVKSKWLAGSLITDLAVFYTDRRDAQLINTIQIGQSFPTYTDNAGSATHKGIEASFNWLVDNNIRLLGSFGLLDAEFDTYENGSLVLSGRQVAHAPDYTYNLGTELYLTPAWTLRTNVEGKDEFYFSDSHDAKSKNYTLVNASIDYSHKNWNISLWTRNLFNENYYTRGFFFGNNPSTGYTPTRYIQFGEPRVAGITVKYDY